MKIRVPKVDGRSFEAQRNVFILNEESGEQIGHIENRRGYNYSDGERQPSRFITLFGGKYTGHFETHEECAAFAKGVEQVINHMVSGAYPPPD